MFLLDSVRNTLRASIAVASGRDDDGDEHGDERQIFGGSAPSPSPVTVHRRASPVAGNAARGTFASMRAAARLVLAVLAVVSTFAGVFVGVACPAPPPSSTSPEALTELLSDRFFSFEELVPATETSASYVQQATLWFGADGRLEQHPLLSAAPPATWAVAGDGLITISLGRLNDLPVRVTRLADDDDGNPRIRLDGDALPRHDYTGSATCPAYVTRIDSRVTGATLFETAASPVFQGHNGLAFDDEGDLHVLGTTQPAEQDPTSFYATTVGARCGLQTYTFETQSFARLAVDDDGGLHAAFIGAGGTLRYAWRPAQAPSSTPWQTLDVGTSNGPLSLAVRPDGFVAVVASDGVEYRVWKSPTPLDASSWQVSTLPVQRTQGSLLVYSASLAFDASGRLYVAATDGTTTAITVFRDDDDAWTPLSMPPYPAGGIFEGPDAFAIDSAGRLYFVIGDLGIEAGNNRPARAGDLVLGTALLDGAVDGAVDGVPDGALDAASWHVVAAGGRPVLELDKDDRVHLYSSSRLTGGWHTIVEVVDVVDDADAGDEPRLIVDRWPVEPWLEAADHPDIAVGRGGRAALGLGTAAQIEPGPERLASVDITFRADLAGDAGQTQIVFPDFGKTCQQTCDFTVPAGTWLQWRVERGARDPVANTLFTAGGFDATLNPGGDGTNGIFAGFGTCKTCLQLQIGFAAPELLAHAVLTPTSWPVGSPELVGPVDAAVGAPAVVGVVQQAGSGAQLQRFVEQLSPLSPLDLPGWSTVTGVSWDTPGLVVLVGTTTAQTSVGDVAGFVGEPVVVGVRTARDLADDATTPPSVAWVWRDTQSTAGTRPQLPRRLSTGTAVIVGDAVVVVDDDGQEAQRTSLPALTELVGLSAVVLDDELHVFGVVGASINEAWTRSRWLVVDANGDITGDRNIDGVVVGGAATQAPAVPGILALVRVDNNQPWDGGFVAEGGFVAARLLRDGNLQPLGDVRPVPLGSEPGRPATVRAPGVVELALVREPGATSIVRVDEDGFAPVSGYGNPTTNLVERHTVEARGIATLGASRVLGAIASGPLTFTNERIPLTGRTPVLLELY